MSFLVILNLQKLGKKLKNSNWAFNSLSPRGGGGGGGGSSADNRSKIFKLYEEIFELQISLFEIKKITFFIKKKIYFLVES